MNDHLWDLAETGYKAYTADSDNKNYQGKECPAWDDLPQAIRDHWFAAAKAIVEMHDGPDPAVA